MKPITDLLKAFCLLAAVFALVELGLALREFQIVARETISTVAEMRATVEIAKGAIVRLDAQTTEQLARLRDPRNSKAIDAGLQLAATAKGTILLVNTQVIPRAMKTLDSLNRSADALGTLVQHSDTAINAHLLPEATRTINLAGLSLATLDKSLQDASSRANAGLDSINRVLADPSLQASLASSASILAHVDATAAQIEEASKRVPAIADDIQKISTTSARYRKWILLSQIASALGRAFF